MQECVRRCDVNQCSIAQIDQLGNAIAPDEVVIICIILPLAPLFTNLYNNRCMLVTQSSGLVSQDR